MRYCALEVMGRLDHLVEEVYQRFKDRFYTDESASCGHVHLLCSATTDRDIAPGVLVEIEGEKCVASPLSSLSFAHMDVGTLLVCSRSPRPRPRLHHQHQSRVQAPWHPHPLLLHPTILYPYTRLLRTSRSLSRRPTQRMTLRSTSTPCRSSRRNFSPEARATTSTKARMLRSTVG